MAMVEEKDLEKLRLLENNCIQNMYSQIQKGVDSVSYEELLSLIEVEVMFLQSIDIDKQKLAQIEQFYSKKYGIKVNTNLILGISTSLESPYYIYYRIIARLRYSLCKQVKVDDFDNFLNCYFTDNEVQILYYIIKRDIESGKLSPKLSIKLSNLSYSILIDSVEAEVALIKNDLKPLDRIYDCTDFHTDLISYKMLEKLKYEDQAFYEDNRSSLIQNNKTRSEGKLRIPNFNKKYIELFRELLSSEITITGDLRRSSYFMIRMSYLKALISILSSESRMTVYKDIRKSRFVNDSRYAWMLGFIKDSFCDIEESIVPYIQKVSMIPYSIQK